MKLPLTKKKRRAGVNCCYWLALLLAFHHLSEYGSASNQQRQEPHRVTTVISTTPTIPASNSKLVKSSQDLSTKSISEIPRSQQSQKAQKLRQGKKKQVERRDGANLPELTIEDDSADSYLAEEASYDGSGGGGGVSGGGPTTMLDSGEAGSYTSDYETDAPELVDVSGQAQQMRPHQMRSQRQSPVQVQQQQQLTPANNNNLRNQQVQQQQQHQQVRTQQQQQQQSPFQRPVTLSPINQLPTRTQLLMSSPSTPSTFTSSSMTSPVGVLLNQQMAGSNQHHHSQMLANSNFMRPQLLASDQQELAHTESIQRELLARAHGSTLSEQRRPQEMLMYPTSTVGSPISNGLHHHHHHMAAAQQAASSEQHMREATSVGICYTPVALLMVILTTMLVTVLVSFGTHYLIKQLSRRQFDLIANSKHYETKHGYLDAGASESRTFTSGAARCSLNRTEQLEAANQVRQSEQNMLNMLFQHEQPAAAMAAFEQEHCGFGKSGNKLQLRQQQQQQLRDEHGCAFDNPYFRDEPASLVNGYANTPGCQLSAKSPATNKSPFVASNQVEVAAQQVSSSLSDEAKQLSEKEAPRSEQLNFIEHHISNLHSRQVTSSVKELSVLGSPNSHHVVDLTSAELRAKVIADPKEGDLVAVDITGHDFIGLGFDLCGNAQEGIFVRSVLSRGPARESGCIHPGDRIKCLNISFENVTLQDACDILNCGSPYKLRLLLEKRAAPAKLVEKLRQPVPIMMRRNHRYNSNHLQHPHLSDQQRSAIPTAGGSLTDGRAGAGNPIGGYLRRIAQILAPKNLLANLPGGGDRTSQQRLSAGLDYRQQFGVRSPNEPLEPPLYLGSAAARRHLLQGRGSTLSGSAAAAMQVGAQVNAGYTGSELGLDGSDNNNLFAGDELTQHSLAVRRRLSVSSLGPATMLTANSGRFSNHSELFAGSMGGVNESNSALGGTMADSSLEYHSKNAHHKLHGPADCFLGLMGDQRGVFPLNSRLLSGSSHEVTGAAANILSSGTGAQLIRRIGTAQAGNQLEQHQQQHHQVRKFDHLDQTQSQPEIAQHSNQLAGEISSSSELASKISVINPRNNSNRLVANSVSTPAMNLLASSSSIQQQADWQTLSRSSKKDNGKGKGNQQEETMTISENSSFADSTSKLVSGTDGKLDNKHSSRVNSEPLDGSSAINDQTIITKAVHHKDQSTTLFPPNHSNTLAADSNSRQKEIHRLDNDSDDATDDATVAAKTTIKEKNQS